VRRSVVWCILLVEFSISFVVDCRPKSVSMGNFIRAFKNRVTENRGRSEVDGKASLQAFLEEFLDERFLTAQSLIVDNGVKKIVDGEREMKTQKFSCCLTKNR
jgi:translation initiation factor 2B subunit (eIF-2B alpha/beta/delta family)